MLNLIMIALGLSMDAFAVSMTNAMCMGGISKKPGVKRSFFSYAFTWSFLFGVFQGVMPLIGFFLGKTFSHFISAFDHWVAFFLLAAIGLKMIWEAFQNSKEPESCSCRVISVQTMITQAIATSIDALAVGVSFALLSINIVAAAIFIAVITLVCSLVGSYIGKIFGGLLKTKAEIFGGTVLFLIGAKILLEHTLLA